MEAQKELCNFVTHGSSASIEENFAQKEIGGVQWKFSKDICHGFMSWLCAFFTNLLDNMEHNFSKRDSRLDSVKLMLIETLHIISMKLSP